MPSRPQSRTDGHPAPEGAAPDVLAELYAAGRDARRIADVATLEDVEGLPSGAFDVVHCSWVLHDLADAPLALRAMTRAVRPGGQVVVQWDPAPAAGHAHPLDDVCLALFDEGLEVVIAEDDIEMRGGEGYAARVVAHREAPTSAQDDAVRPSGVRAFPLSMGILEVVAAERLTPNMRRVVLTGEAIGDLPVEEPGEILTLIWPPAGSETIVLPALRRWRFPDGAGEQHARNLTIRALDRARGRVTIDFFLHGDDGRASRWARDATEGDVVGYGGPRPHWRSDPAAGWTLLIGDETGLPAIGAIVEQRPVGHRTLAVVEVQSRAEEQALTSPGALELHWVHRGARAPGCGTDLLDAVRALALPSEGRPQVWAAGESRLMRSIREHLRDERGLPRTAMNVLGYWKRDETGPAS